MVGVDAHTDTHDAAVLDGCGRLLATRAFRADAAGYDELLVWAQQFGVIAAFGVESTGSYAAGLVRHLRGAAWRSFEDRHRLNYGGDRGRQPRCT